MFANNSIILGLIILYWFLTYSPGAGGDKRCGFEQTCDVPESGQRKERQQPGAGSVICT